MVLNVLLRWLLLPPGPLTNEQALYFDYTQPEPTAVSHFLPQPDTALALLVRGVSPSSFAVRVGLGFPSEGHFGLGLGAPGGLLE